MFKNKDYDGSVSGYPSMDLCCDNCGARFGQHSGVTCPPTLLDDGTCAAPEETQVTTLEFSPCCVSAALLAVLALLLFVMHWSLS